jgi:hypothetical protein
MGLRITTKETGFLAESGLSSSILEKTRFLNTRITTKETGFLAESGL